MKETRILMGMPVTIEIADPAGQAEFDQVYAYFEGVDRQFSTYKADSELSRLNRGEFALAQASAEMQNVFRMAETLRQHTDGYFDIRHNGATDPSGLVKGWAIFNAAEMLWQQGFKNFYVEAGGDFQVYGRNAQGQEWRMGIRSPFNMHEIVKVIAASGCGVATSGSYIRGQHIYNPKDAQPLDEIVSLTVIGPNVFEADCFATAAFAMGREGIGFIASLEGFEGYMIDREGLATSTSGFARYVIHD